MYSHAFLMGQRIVAVADQVEGRQAEGQRAGRKERIVFHDGRSTGSARSEKILKARAAEVVRDMVGFRESGSARRWSFRALAMRSRAALCALGRQAQR